MKRLVLINVSLDENYFRKGDETLTLAYLSEVLKNKYDITLLPLKNYHRNDFASFTEEILSKIINADEIGISTNTFSKYYSTKLSNKIRKKYPHKKVFFGGQGIESDHSLLIPSDAKEPILVCNKISETSYDIELLLTNLCPQNCGYCSSPKNQLKVSVSDYIKKIKACIENGQKIRRIILYDNNPLHPLNFKRTYEFFSAIENDFGYLPDSIFYCDPSLLTDKKEFNKISGFLKRFKSPNSNLYFGRERPDAKIAAKIKRRILGNLRTQKELDSERQALLKLASMLNKTPHETGLNFSLVLNYILTPFETYESINRLLEEAKAFMKFRRVIIKSNFLWIFPHTEISKDYRNKYIPAEKFKLELKFFGNDSINYWKEDFENSQFLDLCNALSCRLFYQQPNEDYSWYNLSMLKLARDISLKKYKNNTIDTITKDIPLRIRKNLGKKFDEFKTVIDKDRLHIMSIKNKVALMRISNHIFLNVPEDMIMMMAEEFKKILETRNRL
ncbi:MAG: hypothetical protein ABIJ34_06435 [archaeon]